MNQTPGDPILQAPAVLPTRDHSIPRLVPRVSIVIPVYRDEPALGRLLPQVLERDADSMAACRPDVEIVVATTAADAESVEGLKAAYPDLVWVESARGRARQMNAGAARAAGKWLLFLHADTRLPSGWFSAIDEAEGDPSVAMGCFRFALDSTRLAARILEVGVRWRVRLFDLPYGDQALFIRAGLFRDLGGYADIPIMEDVDLVARALECGRLYRSALPATTSSRLWEDRGWMGTTARHLGLIMLYRLGVRPETLVRLARTRRR